MPAYVAIHPRVRPITSTSITRSCDSAVVVMRSIASVAICTAVSKPKVTSVAAMSLSIVFGTPTIGTPSAESRSAVRSVPSPPITTTASIPSRSSVSVTDAAPLPWTYGSRRDVPRIVPPRWRMPRTASRSSGRSCPSMRPSHPSRIPTTSAPCRPAARAVTPRITAFSPGQSPPAVRIASRFIARIVWPRLRCDSTGSAVSAEAVATATAGAFRDVPRRRRGSSRGIRLLPNPAWRASTGTSACRRRGAPWAGSCGRRTARRRRRA